MPLCPSREEEARFRRESMLNEKAVNNEEGGVCRFQTGRVVARKGRWGKG
jgi:hypothetical protein